MAKHFLYLTNLYMTGFVIERGRILSSEAFSTLDGTMREFERYLVKHRKLAVHLVLDLTEEDYRSETIPHLRGGDQLAVLNRRLGQIYRNSPFKHAVVQGREADGRKDDKVLYHGVPNADLVKPWLTVLERLEIPLEGIYSAPVLSGQLLQSLDVFFPHTLLVSLSSGHGLRQTYFQNKHVKFSRLTQLQSTDERPLGALVAEECSRTWQYLDSLRFLSGDDQLEVCILVTESQRAELSAAIKDYPLLQFRLLDVQEVARSLKLRDFGPGEYSDALFVSVFAKSRLENHFAQSDQTRVARLRRAGAGLYALSSLVAAGSVVGALGMLVAAQQYSFDATRLQSQSAALSQQYKQLMGQMQTAQVSADTSRETAAFAAGFIDASTTPSFLMGQVSQVFNRFPDVNLKYLAWRMSGDEKAPAPSTPAGAKSSLPVRSELTTGQGDERINPSNAAAATSPAQGNPSELVIPATDFQVLVIDATVGPFDGDYRALLERINAFVAELGKLPGCSAALLSAPVDVKSSGTIKGTLSTSPVGAQEVPFKVRVVRINRVPEVNRGK